MNDRNMHPSSEIMDIIAFKHQPSGQFAMASKKVRCHTPMDGMGADLVVYSISLCWSATLGIYILWVYRRGWMLYMYRRENYGQIGRNVAGTSVNILNNNHDMCIYTGYVKTVQTVI